MTTLYELYLQVTSANLTYNDLEERWQFYLQSYQGGEEYRMAGHLTRYVNESGPEYQARLASTPLDNHCRSVISVYTSFLFREEPERELGSLQADPMLEDFIKDADLDGRSLNSFMKEVSIWSNVFGHCFILLTKPNVGAVTMADEQASGVRPYVNLLTPLNDFVWNKTNLYFTIKFIFVTFFALLLALFRFIKSTSSKRLFSTNSIFILVSISGLINVLLTRILMPDDYGRLGYPGSIYFNLFSLILIFSTFDNLILRPVLKLFNISFMKV